MIISLSENCCFMCGRTEGITKHHALPLRLNPQNNILIPLCDKCHYRINTIDIASLLSHLYTIQKRSNEDSKSLNLIISVMKKYDGGKFLIPVGKPEGDDCNGNG